MVGYAFAAQYPKRVTRFVLIDAPLPGIGPWEGILKNPLLWHFRFGGPDMERLVARRERIYLDRFWNEFSTTPSRFSEAARTHYAKLYAMPGAMHSGFMQFAAFDRDAKDNQAYLAQGKLAMPVLAIGGEKSFGKTMAEIMRFAASDVREGVSQARMIDLVLVAAKRDRQTPCRPDPQDLPRRQQPRIPPRPRRLCYGRPRPGSSAGFRRRCLRTPKSLD